MHERRIEKVWVKLDKNTIIDYDKDDNVIGVELLFVKEHNLEILKSIEVENLVVA
jgi:uncharacterized protein YuzE